MLGVVRRAGRWRVQRLSRARRRRARSGWTAATARFANLQEHIDPSDLTAVVITHGHPDHCVDIYGLHVHATATASSVQRPPGVRARGARAGARRARRHASATPSTGAWSATATAPSIGEADAALLAHRPPAAHVWRSRSRTTSKRLVYTADTGPGVERRRVRPRRRPRALRGDLPARRHPARRSTSRRAKPATRRATRRRAG